MDFLPSPVDPWASHHLEKPVKALPHLHSRSYSSLKLWKDFRLAPRMLVSIASSSLKIHRPHQMQTKGLVPTGTRAAGEGKSIYRWPLRGRSGHALSHHCLAEVSPSQGLVPPRSSQPEDSSFARTGAVQSAGHRYCEMQMPACSCLPHIRLCPAHRCLPLAVPVGLQPCCRGMGSSSCTPEKASVVRERMDWASSDAQRNSSVCSAHKARGRSAVGFCCRK